MLLSQLCLAYLCTQFLARPASLIANRGRSAAVALYWAMYVATALFVINVGLTRPTIWTVVALGLAHATIDQVDRRLGWRGFLATQLVNTLLIVIAADRVAVSSWGTVASQLRASLSGPRPYVFAATYVAAIGGGDVLVQRVAQAFLAKIESSIAAMKPGLPAAGRYIGWLERFLILTFVLVGNYEAIAYLLAAKALVRYPEIKEDQKGHFGEYFLVGTLTSVGIALTAGVSLRWVVERFLTN